MGILILLAIAFAAFFVFYYQQGTSTNKLRSLLAAGKWKEANEETERLITLNTARLIRGEIALQDSLRELLHSFGISYGMFTKFKLSYGHSLSYEEISQIPCHILHEIDQLWVLHSNGHFGFSIQLGILEECKKVDYCKKKEIQEFDRKMFTSTKGWYDKDRPWFSVSLADTVEVLMLWERLGWMTRGCDRWGEYCYLPTYSMSELNYSLSSPKGYLPVFPNWSNMHNIYTINVLQRLQNCSGHSVYSISQVPIVDRSQ
jgi:GUN4-like